MAKTLTRQQLLGERGMALVSELVHKMGLVWRATSTSDTGIDGQIELRNPSTGEVTGQLVQVQVKATQSLQNDTGATFVFRAERRDVEYWVRSNIPVVLIVTVPDKAEAYWLCVRQRCYDEKGLLANVFTFNKSEDRFDKAARERLAELVLRARPGYYEPAPAINETLVSNLLPVTAMPQRIYVAPTEHRTRPAVWNALKEAGYEHVGAEWILNNKMIVSVHDLREAPYSACCDAGACDDFAVSEWSSSEDSDRLHQFVQLLNACLREKTHEALRFNHEPPQTCLHFKASKERLTRGFAYVAEKNRTSRSVVTVKRDKERRVSFVRHNAFKWRFRRFDREWYLEITPTYLFTSDGYKPLRRYEELLKGIKRLENNSAVLGQLQMWTAFLTQESDMLRQDYRLLSFGPPARFSLNVGVNETEWSLKNKGQAAGEAPGFTPLV